MADGEDQAALEASCAPRAMKPKWWWRPRVGQRPRLWSGGRASALMLVADGEDQAASAAGGGVRGQIVGTDYCDITGEMAFVWEMIAQHDDAARKSGARIVHLCGHDSVPWDLSTLMLAKSCGSRGRAKEGARR